MLLASRRDAHSFDRFSLFQNGLNSPEVAVGKCEVLQALMIALLIAVLDEAVNLLSGRLHRFAPSHSGREGGSGPSLRSARTTALRGGFNGWTQHMLGNALLVFRS